MHVPHMKLLLFLCTAVVTSSALPLPPPMLAANADKEKKNRTTDTRRAQKPQVEGLAVRSQQFVSLLRNAVLSGQLPFTNPRRQFTGSVNAEVPGRDGRLVVPMRDWRRGAQSNSISRQTQHAFMWRFVDEYGPKLRKRARCLDWDGWYVGSIFDSICAVKDVVEYARPLGRSVPVKPLKWAVDGVVASHWYHADAHNMSEVLEHGVYDVVIANSVFEHLHQPFEAMKQIATVLRPGGYLFWHTPFEYERHGSPDDFFRYTTSGARTIAESAGLHVDFSEGDGGFAAVFSNLLGLGAKFWSDEELQRNANANTKLGRPERKQVVHYRALAGVRSRNPLGLRFALHLACSNC